MKVVIIGGVAGGASAAARLRRLDEKAEIIIFERSGYISYANCGLPYYVGGTIEEESNLTLQTPASFFRRFRIDARVRHEVLSIDPASKTVRVKKLDTLEEFSESYDRLILAPGAKPSIPALSGIESERIFTLRTVEDSLRIRHFVREQKPRSAVVAGGGYIGVEMAENLRQLGLEVSILQRPLQLLNNLDGDMAALVHARIRAEGIALHLGATVKGFRDTEDGIETLTDKCEPIRSDMVILALGVTPETTLARQAGLKLGLKDSILVDSHMESSIPGIYAVGDAVQVKNSVSGADALISLAGPANKQGRIAADNICGIPSEFKGAQGSSIVKIFDMTAASTGLSEKAALDAGYEIEKAVITSSSHASYYPGGKSMVMKAVCDRKTGQLLGAQIVGYDGVDKRIDVLATAIHCRMKGSELKELDLSYAPPFSSAKDPVNMLGFVLENLFNRLVKQFHYNEVAELQQRTDVVLLDTRTQREFERGHAEGFLHIPVDELRERMGEIPTGKKVYVMCQSGLRSYIACRILTGYGFECYNFSGGYSFYSAVLKDRAAAKETLPCGMEK